MQVQCGQCPAKYAVADDRIRDKKVRIRCRRCNAAIVVDGKVEPPLVTSTPARPSARPLSSMPPESGPASSPPALDSRADAPRPVAHTIMGGLEAPIARKLVQEHVAQTRSSPPPKPTRSDPRAAAPQRFTEPRQGRPAPDRGFTDPPVGGEPDRWRVALTQQDLRWMTTDEILQAFRAGAVKSETFVFRTGMPTWVTLMEVSEIAQALFDAGLAAPGSVGVGARPEAREPRPSSPPPRLSSLPPPRKATRNRGAPTFPRDAAVPDDAAEPDESLPFALVSERSNGGKKAAESPAPQAGAEDASLATPLVPTAAEALASSGTALPAHAAPDPRPVAVAAPALATPPATPVASESGPSLWIWVLLALLLAVGAALFFGPRFGLRLP
ncbi:MAG TPA: zinc-ribbon domain-containing protein [Polyangiaceae bacterium]|nr:zinc-ribbon domain-containing protein [Polyangiaceae bacterium]